jgi:hypothetical protein
MKYRDGYHKDRECTAEEHEWFFEVEEGVVVLRCLDPCLIPETDEEFEDVYEGYMGRICINTPAPEDIFMAGHVHVSMKTMDEGEEGIWFEIAPIGVQPE